MPAEIIIVVDRKDSYSPQINLQNQSRVNLKFISTKKDYSGVSIARNLGAKFSKSNWLAFLDDDDLWLPLHLQSCYETAIDQQANLVCSSFFELKEGLLKKEKDSPIDFNSADFFSNNPGFRGSNIFIRKDLYSSIKGFDESLRAFNDCDFGIRLKEVRTLKYSCIRDPLVIIRKHDNKRLTTSKIITSSAHSFIQKHKLEMSVDKYEGFTNRLKKYWNINLI